MKRVNRFWVLFVSAVICLVGVARLFHAKPVHAQQNSGDYNDGTFYILASVDVDSSYNLYVESYMEVEYDDYEDIDYIEVDGTADQDNDTIGDGYQYGDDDDPADVQLQSNGSVPTGHEYGMESDGYACYDDGEGDEDDCDFEYVGSAYASVEVGFPSPYISSISPSSVNQGDTGTLTITGTNLVEGSGDQLTLNYSGSGMPFTLTGTPSSTSATFSYDVSGYDTGTYTISVTNNEGTSNGKSFTVNQPQYACTQSRTPNAVTLQITAFGNTGQGGTFTVSHPTAITNNAATTVNYGPYSTPSSVASSIASAITRKYAYQGINAQANGATITLQSRSIFGTLSSSSSGSTFSVNMGTPSSVSCLALPALPCAGLFPNYDRSRGYDNGTFTETARQHIIRKHILGTPSPGPPPNTVYINNKPTADEMFILVQGYNFTTVFEQWIPTNGYFYHKFDKTYVPTAGGIAEKGFIGKDAAGNDLYINKLYLSADRCTVSTSFPVLNIP